MLAAHTYFLKLEKNKRIFSIGSGFLKLFSNQRINCSGSLEPWLYVVYQNQVFSFLRTTVMNSQNHPDNCRGFVPASNNHIICRFFKKYSHKNTFSKESNYVKEIFYFSTRTQVVGYLGHFHTNNLYYSIENFEFLKIFILSTLET